MLPTLLNAIGVLNVGGVFVDPAIDALNAGDAFMDVANGVANQSSQWWAQQKGSRVLWEMPATKKIKSDNEKREKITDEQKTRIQGGVM